MSDTEHTVLNEGTMRVPQDWQYVVQTVFMTDDHATLVIQPRRDAEPFATTLAMAANDLPEFKLLDRRPIALARGQGEMAELSFRLDSGVQHQIVVRFALDSHRSLTFFGTTVAPMAPATRSAILAMIASFRPYARDP